MFSTRPICILPSTTRICFLNLNRYYRRQEQSTGRRWAQRRGTSRCNFNGLCLATLVVLDSVLHILRVNWAIEHGSQTASHSCPSLTACSASWKELVKVGSVMATITKLNLYRGVTMRVWGCHTPTLPY